MDSVQFQSAIIENVVLDEGSITQAIKDGFDEADLSDAEGQAIADDIAAAFGFEPAPRDTSGFVSGGVTGPGRLAPEGQAITQQGFADAFGQAFAAEIDANLFGQAFGLAPDTLTGDFTPTAPLATGLTDEDLDLVSLNVAELLQGTLADQVLTIMPQDGVMRVMLQQQDLIRVKVEGGTLDDVKNTIKIQGDVNATQVGTFAVTQSGAWVMQLAGGGTIPVRVEGGRMVVDIGSGLEALAIDLADEEVLLREVGAI